MLKKSHCSDNISIKFLQNYILVPDFNTVFPLLAQVMTNLNPPNRNQTFRLFLSSDKEAKRDATFFMKVRHYIASHKLLCGLFLYGSYMVSFLDASNTDPILNDNLGHISATATIVYGKWKISDYAGILWNS